MMQDSNGTSANTPLFGAGQEQGRRKSLEDRLRVGIVTTGGGLTLTVAMVADGIGGAAFGERAAELAIESAFRVIETSPVNDCATLPLLLEMALEQAQQAIVAEQRQEKAKRGMGTTAVLAVICEGALYLANIGDSRAYLVRGDELFQLSRDHSWGLEMLRQGLMKDPDEAARHPKTDELHRSLGSEDNFEIDLGVYLNRAGSEGVPAVPSLALQPNDRLLLCSDGLVRARITGSGHYVEDSEIVYSLTHRAPGEAATELVQRAVARQADDNVSAIVVEMPGSERKFALPAWTRYAVAGLAGVLLVMLAAFLLTRDNGETEAPATIVPLPTMALNATVAPPAEIVDDGATTPGVVVRLVESGTETSTGWTLLDDGTPVLIPSGLEPMQIRYEDGSELYLAPETEVLLAQAENGSQIRVQVNQGDAVFWTAGAPAFVSNRVGSWVRIIGPGAMVGVSSRSQPSVEFLAHCLAGGPCELKGDLDETVMSLATGEAGQVGGPGRPEAAGPADYGLFSAFAIVVPAPTATMTATATEEPTATLPPTATPTRRPGSLPVLPTNTPRPTSQPAATTTPDRDDNPGPRPTSRPPTNTPEPPPTSTPNTPEPPPTSTPNTPEPPPTSTPNTPVPPPNFPTAVPTSTNNTPVP